MSRAAKAARVAVATAGLFGAVIVGAVVGAVVGAGALAMFSASTPTATTSTTTTVVHARLTSATREAHTADSTGYWLVSASGGVYAFGTAGFYGSMGGKHLNAPITGIVPTSDGKGYWLVAKDGGVFAFGDAPFVGSMSPDLLTSPIMGMANAGNTTTAGPMGPQGATGPAGPQGSTGAQLLSGTGRPGSLLGANGDYYLETTTSMLYGPKADSAWPACSNLKGSNGPEGSMGPQGDTGAAGATGQDGATGPTGATGPAGTGVFGSFYQTTTQFTYPGSPIPLPVTQMVSSGFGYTSGGSITIFQAGTYEVTYTALGLPSDTTPLGLMLSVNGMTVGGTTFSAGNAASGPEAVSGQAVININANDTITLSATASAELEPDNGANTASIIFTRLGDIQPT
jgi:hypothetical protein